MNVDFYKGLVPAIIQEESSGEVLMLGFMNAEAWWKTQQDRVVWFYSRSKQRLWKKGETSGNVLHVQKVAVDCDGDALLIQVKPQGVVCHKGTKSCFCPLEVNPNA